MHLRGVWAVVVLGVLFVSLGANFFLAGWFFERSRDAPWRGGPPGAVSVFDFPPEAQQAVRRRFQEERRRAGFDWEELRAKRREVSDAMLAPVIDRAAVAARMAELRSLTDRMQQRAQEVMLDALEQMTPQQRAEIAERRRAREEERARFWRERREERERMRQGGEGR
jgi:Spy/CpxP family protein refolding chaperone